MREYKILKFSFMRGQQSPVRSHEAIIRKIAGEVSCLTVGSMIIKFHC